MPRRASPPHSATGPAHTQPLVLLVEDDLKALQVLVSTLATHGIRSIHAGSKLSALARGIRCQPDLVLVDSSAAGVDAVAVAGQLREWTSVPILVLLPRAKRAQGASLLDAGASDYVLKPFAVPDLMGRMGVWIRQQRVQHVASDPASSRLRIDFEKRMLFVDGRDVHLTPLECKLLRTLSRRPAALVTEEQLVTALWGKGVEPRAHHLRARVRQLRQKIERDPARPTHLVGEGKAFRLKP